MKELFWAATKDISPVNRMDGGENIPMVKDGGMDRYFVLECFKIGLMSLSEARNLLGMGKIQEPDQPDANEEKSDGTAIV